MIVNSVWYIIFKRTVATVNTYRYPSSLNLKVVSLSRRFIASVLTQMLRAPRIGSTPSIVWPSTCWPNVSLRSITDCLMAHNNLLETSRT